MDREQQLKEIAYELHRELGRSPTMKEINEVIASRSEYPPRHAREESEEE